MRISDWSSDVCSSDLLLDNRRRILDIGQYGGCEAVARPIDDRSAGHDPCARRICSLPHAVDPGELAGRDARPQVRPLLPGIAYADTPNGCHQSLQDGVAQGPVHTAEAEDGADTGPVP